jgi:hypothetical protein
MDTEVLLSLHSQPFARFLILSVLNCGKFGVRLEICRQLSRPLT